MAGQIRRLSDGLRWSGCGAGWKRICALWSRPRGRAWLPKVVDDDDPFPFGYTIGDIWGPEEQPAHAVELA
jgi:hypothetical protein